MGVNRVVEGIGIPHPVGDPTLPKETELHLRMRILETAIVALETEVTAPTVFKVIPN